jgi:hypothetical protein
MLAGTSGVLSFALPTSVHSGPAPYPFRLGLVSDVGQTMNSSTTMDHLLVRAGALGLSLTLTLTPTL